MRESNLQMNVLHGCENYTDELSFLELGYLLP